MEWFFADTWRTILVGTICGILLYFKGWDIADPVSNLITLAFALAAWFEAKKIERSLQASVMEQKTFQITFGLRAGYEGEAQIFQWSHATDAVADWQQARVNAGLPIVTGYTTEITLVYPVRNGEAANRITKEKSGMYAGSLSPKYDIGRSDEEVIDTLSSLASHIGLCLKQKRVYFSYHGKQWVIDTAVG